VRQSFVFAQVDYSSGVVPWPVFKARYRIVCAFANYTNDSCVDQQPRLEVDNGEGFPVGWFANADLIAHTETAKITFAPGLIPQALAVTDSVLNVAIPSDLWIEIGWSVRFNSPGIWSDLSFVFSANTKDLVGRVPGPPVDTD